MEHQSHMICIFLGTVLQLNMTGKRKYAQATLKQKLDAVSLWIRESLFKELLKSFRSPLVLCPTGQKTMMICMSMLPEMNRLMPKTLPASKVIHPFLMNTSTTDVLLFVQEINQVLD